MKNRLILTYLGCSILTTSLCSLSFQARGNDDPRLVQFVSDGFDMPVESINTANYGFEYSQPWRASSGQPFSTLHPAIDINTNNDCGREVKAVASGIVKYKGNAGASFGGVVMVQHRFYREPDTQWEDGTYEEYTSQYAHIAPLDSIRVDDYVYRGQVLGYIAWNNNSCNNFAGVTDPHQYNVTWSPHLHFEMRSDVGIAANAWPTFQVDGTGLERKNRVDAQGYLLPFNSPYASDNYNDVANDNAEEMFGSNSEVDTNAITQLSNLNLMSYTEDDSADPRRTNKNHVLTKRQVVEILASTLSYKLNKTIPSNPIQYAVEQQLINTSSPDADDFDLPVKREIVFIVASRANQILSNGSINTLPNCSASSFIDVADSHFSCPYIEDLFASDIFSGFEVSNERKAFAASYSTREFVAQLGAQILAMQNDCLSTIALNQSVKDNWESNCESVNRNNSFAKFYKFTLLNSEEVTISLDSAIDTYLFLLDGENSNGAVLNRNDDSNGTRNSQIIQTLAGGTYTIEATTYSSGKVGAFDLSVKSKNPCNSYIAVGETIQGDWTANCGSVNRAGKYAKFYTFTLDTERSITIDLKSVEDTYLFLIEGGDTSGTVLDKNDDSNGSRNSQISRTLSSGTYTIEATTYSSNKTGSFSISVN